MVLLMIAYNRPQYVRRSLAALARMRGIKNCELFFQADGGGGVASLKEAYEWESCPISIELNKTNLGCNNNVLRGLSRAFAAGNRVGVIEDDVEVSEDWLEFVSRPEFEPYIIRTFRKHDSPPVPDFKGWELTGDFCPWGWVAGLTHFREMQQYWTAPPHIAWDSWLAKKMFGKYPPGNIVLPKVGRSFNFGEIGTYCANKETYLKNNYTPYWAGKMT